MIIIAVVYNLDATKRIAILPYANSRTSKGE